MTRQKLELTWIGKENRPRLEPRILLEDDTKSHHARVRVSEKDIFDNVLIHGDNLLALKALEHEYAGEVKCIFIDPPYNTGSAFAHYDDGIEHSVWLSMMRDRLELLRRLLSNDGSLWMTIDDNECHYLKVLCDEIFGRSNFVQNLTWEKSSPPRIHHNISRKITTTSSSMRSKRKNGEEISCLGAKEAIPITKTPTMIPVVHGFL